MSKKGTQALLEQIESGKLDSDKARILNFIKKRLETSIIDIRSHLKIKHQTVTARCSDLMDSGLIKEIGESRSGKYTLFAFVSCKKERADLIKERNQLNFKKWCKKGLNSYHGYISSDVEVFLNSQVC